MGKSMHYRPAFKLRFYNIAPWSDITNQLLILLIRGVSYSCLTPFAKYSGQCGQHYIKVIIIIIPQTGTGA